MKLTRGSFFVFMFAAAMATFSSRGEAQPPPSGAIAGRISDVRSGEYLENARISIEGTSREVFTDADGNYHLTNLSPGPIRMRIFYTGMETQTVDVPLMPGETVQRDITLSPSGMRTATGEAGSTVQLSKFVVEASREMSAAALAINEQRFAPNMKTVVATDELGNTADSHPGEFLKFVPGITINYNAGNAREISLNGVPPDNVPVTLDGFSLAYAEGGAGRAPAIDFISINSASRIEVSNSPTPESQGSALAGSVNIVPRSAFGRSRSEIRASVYLTMRDDERDFNKTPGPRDQDTRKVYPGFDFGAVVPVNKRFGFTLSGGRSVTNTTQKQSDLQWRGVSAVTNGVAFPHTTVDVPYLSQYIFRHTTNEAERRAYGITFDYLLTPKDRLSFSYQWSMFSSVLLQRNITFNTGRVASFTSTSTQGAPGAGILQNNAVNGIDRYNRTYMPTLVWRHDGPVWKAEAGLGFSFNTNRVREKDSFIVNNAQRTGVTISFADIFYLRPRVITVTDAGGNAVDPYDISTYAVTGATSQKRDSTDQKRTAYANARRDFHGPVPFSLKGGVDFRDLTRTIRNNSSPYNYVGPDGRPSTTPIGSDDSAAPFVDEGMLRRRPPYGFPHVGWLSPEKLNAGFVANPQYFVLDENAQYRNRVTMSTDAKELVSSAFVRADLSLLQHRLKLVGGLRAEQTNVDAYGPLTDASRNVRRDAQGNVIRGANGNPLPITTVPLEVAQLTIIERGNRVDKEFLRLFPNINASYSLRDNLVFRAAHYYSLGRPGIDQYAGGLTLPDTESAPSATNRIVVTNPGIKPWTARTTNVRLEYYFTGVGLVSVSAFRRDFENFFGGTVTRVTPEFLQPFGLDYSTYEAYDVATQYNLEGSVRMTGIDLSYKQALTFLPHWARGLQVFANGSAMRAMGPAIANFTGMNMIPRSGSWGVSLTRERFNVRMHWSYRGRQRNNQVTGMGIEPGTFNWMSKRLQVDLLGEYYLRPNIALFANLRNLRDQPIDQQTIGPNTPEHAQFRVRNQTGGLWTFGVRGTF